MPDLKLIALDAEDLAVLSAHLQDAVLRLGDATWQKRDRRFALVANRFDWQGAIADAGRARPSFERRRTGLRFERVDAVQVSGLDPAKHDSVVSLLAIEWQPAAEAPAGFISLVFSGGGIIRLTVECVEAELQDLGAAWQTRSMPVHADDRAGKGE